MASSTCPTTLTHHTNRLQTEQQNLSIHLHRRRILQAIIARIPSLEAQIHLLAAHPETIALSDQQLDELLECVQSAADSCAWVVRKLEMGAQATDEDVEVLWRGAQVLECVVKQERRARRERLVARIARWERRLERTRRREELESRVQERKEVGERTE